MVCLACSPAEDDRPGIELTSHPREEAHPAPMMYPGTE